jgi:hypothetical protein
MGLLTGNVEALMGLPDESRIRVLGNPETL